jgi:hypothetical protein
MKKETLEMQSNIIQKLLNLYSLAKLLESLLFNFKVSRYVINIIINILSRKSLRINRRR